MTYTGLLYAQQCKHTMRTALTADKKAADDVYNNSRALSLALTMTSLLAIVLIVRLRYQ